MTYGMQALATGKPSNVVEKMVQGRLRKYFEENVLLEQKFVVTDSITVQVCVTKLSHTSFLHFIDSQLY